MHANARAAATTVPTTTASSARPLSARQLCDRGLDLQDCLALAPTPAELADATTWLEPLDLNPSWPAHVRATLGDLARRLGHGS